MARLEGIAKAEYYPTPPSVVERVAALVRVVPSAHRRAVRLFDPCCGPGDALRQFADSLGGGETYGIEIEQNRAVEARAALDHVIAGSAFAVRLGHEAFSCLWLNPPYDQDDGGKRLEHSFLTTISRALAPGGLLVYIVPQARLAQSARYLSTHYERMRCYRFHDPEYVAFRQCVLLAYRRSGPAIAPETKTRVEALGGRIAAGASRGWLGARDLRGRVVTGWPHHLRVAVLRTRGRRGRSPATRAVDERRAR